MASKKHGGCIGHEKALCNFGKPSGRGAYYYLFVISKLPVIHSYPLYLVKVAECPSSPRKKSFLCWIWFNKKCRQIRCCMVWLINGGSVQSEGQQKEVEPNTSQAFPCFKRTQLTRRKIVSNWKVLCRNLHPSKNSREMLKIFEIPRSSES